MQINNGIPVLSEADFSTEEGLKNIEYAAKVGICYFKMTEGCQSRLEDGIKFANNFYKDEELKKAPFKKYQFEGYIQSQKSQYEAIFVPERAWKEYLPCIEVAQTMKQIGIEIIKNTLKFSKFPEDQLDKVTGDLTNDNGWVKFGAQHYRSSVEKQGLPAHGDTGFVTVLAMFKKGLQAIINNEWVDVPPLEGHFVVNWGLNIENLINDKSKVRAIYHRVVQQTEGDRISFAIFADPNPELPIYVRNQEGTDLVKLEESYPQYMDRLHKALYAENKNFL